MKSIAYNDKTDSVIVDEHVSRKILAYGNDLMAVEVHFKQGGVGAPHTHSHAQISYIVSGKFEFTTKDRKLIVGPGDSLYFESGASHGAVCLQEGTILDIFTPFRSDFLSQ